MHGLTSTHPAAGAAPPARPGAPRDWSVRISTFLVGLFAIELVLGGPGYWTLAGVSLRKMLITALAAWFLSLWIAGRLRLALGHVLALALTAAFLLTWIVLIPSIYDARQVEDAVQEGLPIALLFPAVLMHAYFRAQPRAWRTVRAAAGYSLAIVAAATIVLWSVATALDLDPVAVALGAKFYFTAGNLELEPSMYIQRMPDGFFRVMWITSVLFVPGLLYALASRSVAATLLFSMALFASYTRALWLAAAIGIVVAMAASPRGDRFLKLPARHLLLAFAVALSVAVVAVLGDPEESALSAAGQRLGATFSDESAEDRFDQFTPLVEAWQDRPVFGAGLGSAAAMSRSDVAPYLYELTYVALLMKLGVVGMLCWIAAMLVLLLRAPMTDRRQACALASAATFLIATGTNPYLLNLVGIGLLTFLAIELDQPLAQRRAAAQRRSNSP